MGPKLAIVMTVGFVLGVIALVGSHRADTAEGAAVALVVKPELVRAKPLEMLPFTVSETFYGRVEATATVDMAFNIAGRLEQLGPTPDKTWRENDRVQKHDLLATLELEIHRAKVAQAHARRSGASAQRLAADASLSEATANLNDADRVFEKEARLLNSGSTTERAYERALATKKIAEAAVETAKSQQASAAAAYEAADAALREAEAALKEARLISPINGVVAAVPREVGTAVAPGQLIVRIVDLEKVNLVVGVVERKLPRLREGQEVWVDVLAMSSAARVHGVAAQAKPRHGRIKMVPPAADPQTNLFHVEIELDNRDGALKPGMIAKADVTIREDAHAVTVPVEAVNRRGQRGTAFFVIEGLTVGLDLGGLGRSEVTVPAPVAREVIFDLQAVPMEGDKLLLGDVPEELSQLIVEGQSRVRNGQPVRVVAGVSSAASRRLRDEREEKQRQTRAEETARRKRAKQAEGNGKVETNG